MIWNEYFDNIYCHNLSHRPDRWKSVSERFDKYGIEVQRMEAVDGMDTKFGGQWRVLTELQQKALNRSTVLAIIRTYENTIKDAIENGYERILMFEDDVTFHVQFKTLVNEQMKNLPEDWDMVYFGGTRRNYDTVGDVINKSFKKAFWVDGLFAVAVNKRVFKRLLELWAELTQPADSALLFGIQYDNTKRVYCSTPRLCGHDYGYSDNFQRDIQINNIGPTNDLLYDKDIYK